MIHSSADVDYRADVSESASIWHLAQVREGAHVGDETVVGRGAYIDHDVVIGARCKIQNYALIYCPAVLQDGVFIGPAVQLINDPLPRSINPDGSLKGIEDWKPVGVVVKQGASIGAGSIILPGVIIGKWALIGAGSIVTRDVPDYGLYHGRPAESYSQVCKCLKPGCRRECV